MVRVGNGHEMRLVEDCEGPEGPGKAIPWPLSRGSALSVFDSGVR